MKIMQNFWGSLSRPHRSIAELPVGGLLQLLTAALAKAKWGSDVVVVNRIYANDRGERLRTPKAFGGGYRTEMLFMKCSLQAIL